MAYIKLVRGAPVFQIPDDQRVDINSAHQMETISRNAFFGAGLIAAEYAFAIKIDIQRLLELGGNEIIFEVRQEGEGNRTVYKAGIGDIQLQSKLAMNRAKYLQLLGFGDPDYAGGKIKSSISVDEILKNPKYVDSMEQRVGAIDTVSVTRESAENIIQSALVTRNDLGFERFGLTQTVFEGQQDSEDLPRNSEGEINWQELTAEDVANMTDERLNAVSSVALASIKAAGSSGLELGRALYSIPSDVKIFVKDLFLPTYQAESFLDRGLISGLNVVSMTGLSGDRPYESIAVNGEEVSREDYLGPDLDLANRFIELREDPNFLCATPIDGENSANYEASWTLKDLDGLEIDSISYPFSSAAMIADYIETELEPPRVTVTQDLGPTEEPAISISIENRNDINLAFLVEVTIHGYGAAEHLPSDDLGHVLSRAVTDIQIDRFSIILDPNLLNLEQATNQVRAESNIPDPVKNSCILANSEIDFTPFFRNIVAEYTSAVRRKALNFEGGARASLNGFALHLEKALHPPAGSRVGVNVHFMNPLSHNPFGETPASPENIIHSTSCLLNIVNPNAGHGAGDGAGNGGEPEGAGNGAEGGEGGEGGGAAELIITPGCDELFAHSVETTAEDGGRIVVSLSPNTSPNNLSAFTRMRVVRDVVGDGGMKSYCEGNETIIRPFENRDWWTMSECTGQIIRFEDFVQRNQRYRYDIQLADSCGNFLTYQSFLFSQRIQNTNISPIPNVGVGELQILQGSRAASISFMVSGRIEGDANFQLLKDLLDQAGQSEFFSDDIAENVELMQGLLCYEITRTSMTNGSSNSFGIYRGPRAFFKDTPEVCRMKGIPPANPQSDYTYDIHAYIAKGQEAFSSSRRLVVDTPTGNRINVSGYTGLDEFGNQLPDEQQNSIVGRTSYIPAPNGFVPTGVRRYMNVNGTKPSTVSGEGFMTSLEATNSRAEPYYRLGLTTTLDMNDIVRSGFSKYDVYAVFKTGTGNTGAVLIRSHTTPRLSVAIRKSEVWESTPIGTTSFRFKVVAVNRNGQVMSVVDSENTISSPALTANLSEPVIPNPFAGPVIREDATAPAATRRIPRRPRRTDRRRR